MKILAFIALSGTAFFLGSSIGSTTKAHFEGKVVVEWLDNNGPDREMKLLQDFTYVDPKGKYWKVVKGAKIDGASIPQFFWTTIGSPFTGYYRRASVVHDYFCDTKSEKWEDVHEMFYNACITGGENIVQAKIMYAAIYARGPRWEVKKKNLNSAPLIIIKQQAQADSTALIRVNKWIAETNPPLKLMNDSLDNITTAVRVR